MKYCCEYAYFCPARGAVACYAHGGADPCCEEEQRHECLRDMYGGEDGLMYVRWVRVPALRELRGRRCGSRAGDDAGVSQAVRPAPHQLAGASRGTVKL